MARVDLENVSRLFPSADGRPVAAVRNFSLSLGEGELLALVGPSGCGKTTTLRLIAGLDSPDEGTISFDGRPATALPPQDRDVAMVFQQPALYPHLTARENLALGLKLRKLARDEIQRRIGETAERLGLGAVLDRRPAALSGGERQRVALGRALVRRPRVLLLDEPFSSLDAPLRAQLRDDLRRLQRELNLTTLFVTHDQSEALSLGQRVAVMREGSLQQVASPSRLYQRPANVFVAGFIGTPPMNFLPGRLEAGAPSLQFVMKEGPVLPVSADISSGLKAWVGGEALLGLRPEALSLNAECGVRNAEIFRNGASHPPADSLVAIVDSIEETGADTFVRARLGAQLLVFRVSSGASLAPGQRVKLAADPGQFRFFDPARGDALQ